MRTLHDAVAQEVENHLLDLCGIGRDLGKAGGKIEPQPDPMQSLTFLRHGREVKLRCEAEVRFRANMSVAGPMAVHLPWRRALRRHLTVLLLIKFAALAVLWALFFSPAHRIHVDARGAGRQLALPHPDTQANPAAATREESTRD